MPKIILTSLKKIFLSVAAFLLVVPIHAQTVSQFFAFANDKTQGSRPTGSLIQATDGNLYSTAQNEGGTGGLGVAFKISTNGNFTKLTTFTTINDGSFPFCALVQSTNDGNFYGTSFLGIAPLYRGNIYKITSAGVVTSLVAFDGTNGFYPTGALVQGRDGNFYGTTGGGADGCGIFAGGCTGSLTNGSIFKMTPGGTLTTLVTLAGTNGKMPVAGLVLHTNGDFYGTTFTGGANGFGTVFKVTSSGTFTSLYSFAGSDGANPYAGLTIGTNGNLYGTTQGGGANSLGTIFQITAAGVLTTLISFDNANGSTPQAAPKQGLDGNFYGTTAAGGASGKGTVYVLTPGGTLITLYSFLGYNFPSGIPNDGSTPQADLVQISDGNFYGTTRAGGSANNTGTIFKLDLRPKLNSALVGNDVTISWLELFGIGYRLQSASSLTSPISWVDVTNAPVLADGIQTVTETVAGAAKYYRLIK